MLQTLTVEKLKSKLTLDPTKTGEALEFYAAWRDDYGENILDALLNIGLQELAHALPKICSRGMASFQNMIERLATLLDIDKQEVLNLFNEHSRPSVASRGPRDPLFPYRDVLAVLSPEAGERFRAAVVDSLFASNLLEGLEIRGLSFSEDANTHLLQALFCRMALTRHAKARTGRPEIVQILPRIMHNRVLIALGLIEKDHPGFVSNIVQLPPVVQGFEAGEPDYDWEPDPGTTRLAERLADELS